MIVNGRLFDHCLIMKHENSKTDLAAQQWLARTLTTSFLITSSLHENLQLSGQVRIPTKTRTYFPYDELTSTTSLLLPSSGVKMFLHERYQLLQHLVKIIWVYVSSIVAHEMSLRVYNATEFLIMV